MRAPGIEIAVAVAFLSAAQAGECRKGGSTPQPRGLRRPCQPQKTHDSSELPRRIRQQILVPHGQHGKRRTGPAANVARPVEQALAQLRLPLARQGRARVVEHGDASRDVSVAGVVCPRDRHVERIAHEVDGANGHVVGKQRLRGPVAEERVVDATEQHPAGMRGLRRIRPVHGRAQQVGFFVRTTPRRNVRPIVEFAPTVQAGADTRTHLAEGNGGVRVGQKIREQGAQPGVAGARPRGQPHDTPPAGRRASRRRSGSPARRRSGATHPHRRSALRRTGLAHARPLLPCAQRMKCPVASAPSMPYCASR